MLQTRAERWSKMRTCGRGNNRCETRGQEVWAQGQRGVGVAVPGGQGRRWRWTRRERAREGGTRPDRRRRLGFPWVSMDDEEG